MKKATRGIEPHNSEKNESFYRQARVTGQLNICKK